jgi:hypothetical protein
MVLALFGLLYDHGKRIDITNDDQSKKSFGKQSLKRGFFLVPNLPEEQAKKRKPLTRGENPEGALKNFNT